MLRTRLIAASMLGSLALAAGASADVINFTSNSAVSSSSLASFYGNINYNVVDALHATLALTVTNTSPLANGGYLTGVVVGNANQFGSITFSLAGTTDGDFADTSTESASPFGSFRGGAALGANWSGGGSPTAGIAIGQSVTFTFNVSGNGAGFINANSFLTPVDGNQQMVFRFRGFTDGGSDKVPTMLVPGPGAAALAAVGGLMLARRRRHG